LKQAFQILPEAEKGMTAGKIKALKGRLTWIRTFVDTGLPIKE
jgi:hypothetical protein